MQLYPDVLLLNLGFSELKGISSTCIASPDRDFFPFELSCFYSHQMSSVHQKVMNFFLAHPEGPS
jgi:hypothetical protein